MTEENLQPAGSEMSEVSDVLPCVQHKTGALHSIVCWGELQASSFQIDSKLRSSEVICQSDLLIRINNLIGSDTAKQLLE